jgi:hypothetical protein
MSKANDNGRDASLDVPINLSSKLAFSPPVLSTPLSSSPSGPPNNDPLGISLYYKRCGYTNSAFSPRSLSSSINLRRNVVISRVHLLLTLYSRY